MPVCRKLPDIGGRVGWRARRFWGAWMLAGGVPNGRRAAIVVHCRQQSDNGTAPGGGIAAGGERPRRE